MNRKEYTCEQLEQLNKIATDILVQTPKNRKFALYGEMGAGKTTLIKAFCKALMVNDHVSSPSFSIINVYQRANAEKVYHFDCYRIQSIEEMIEIGYIEYFDDENYCFIEWPEKITPLIPNTITKIELIVLDNDQRKIILT